MPGSTDQIELSVVATSYNDSKILPILIEEIIKNIEKIGITYEIIIVNDHSRDNTDKILNDICIKNRNVKGITLARNFGQHIAMTAGINHTSGKFVLVMDGDLQNPPEKIPDLYEEVQKGFDMVYTVGYERNNIFEKITTQFFWFIFSKLFKVGMVKNVLTMQIISRNYINEFEQYHEKIRTCDSIFHQIGSNYSVLKIENNRRQSGKSHYGFFSRMNLALDLILSMSNAPLNFLIYFGIIVFIITLIINIIYLYRYFLGNVPAGYTSLIMAIFSFSSLIIIILGIIGKYLSNIYTEVRQRPLYHISKKYNL
jgi:polyisoprenyl-phosphate glycosyltransferase